MSGSLTDAPVEVLLGLGANLGDPPAQLASAIHRLEPWITDLRPSSLYRSEPVGYRDQPDFYNLVCAGRTELGAAALLRLLLTVEQEEGRVRGQRNGPRSIDIDLLDYGRSIVVEEGLILPHPRMRERAFVLVPLAEIAPGWRHPVSGLTAAEILATAGSLERIEPVGPLRLGIPE